MAQHIVGHRNKRILLNKEFAVLHDDGQTVYVRVDNKPHIGLPFLHQRRYVGQVLGYRLRGVPEVAGRFAV